MTFDDATTTSRCVGRTDTVSCLLDTSWACVQRRNSKLCSKVYDRKSDHNDPPDFAALPQRRPTEYFIYRISGALRYQGGDPRAADRKSVVWGKRVSVGVDHGGRRSIKKKNYLANSTTQII